MLTRRAFLSAPAMFGPWQARPELTIEAAEARLWLPGGGVFSCPSGRARLLAVMRMREMDVAAVSFAADPAGEVQDVLALIGTGGQLLALERLTWRHGKRAELITRMAMLPDRAHISLQRDAARHEGVWRRESWTDYLRLSNAALINAPARPVLAGSWQAALSGERTGCAATLKPGQCGILPVNLALLMRTLPWGGCNPP